MTRVTIAIAATVVVMAIVVMLVDSRTPKLASDVATGVAARPSPDEKPNLSEKQPAATPEDFSDASRSENSPSQTSSGERPEHSRAPVRAPDGGSLTSLTLGVQGANDPRQTMLRLEAQLEDELEQTGENIERAIAVTDFLESSRFELSDLADVAGAVRGVRCASTLCEVVLDASEVDALPVALAEWSRALRAEWPDYVVAVNAANPHDESLWNWYLIREEFFE